MDANSTPLAMEFYCKPWAPEAAVSSSAKIQEDSNVRTLAPISRIPAEILAIILEFASHDDPGIPTSALAVSHFWHKTAMDAAGLWTTISIGPGVDCATAYLARSQGSLLDIVISLDSVEIWDHCLEFCAVIFQDIQRIRTLSLTTLDFDNLKSLLEFLPDTALALTSLDIAIQSTTHMYSLDNHTTQVFPAGAPLLTKFGLSELDIEELVPPLSQVVSLRLDVVLTSSVVRDVLKKTPLLTHLESYGSYAEIRRAPHHAIRIYADVESIGVDNLLLFAMAELPAVLALYDIHAHNMYNALYLSNTLHTHFDELRTLELCSCGMPKLDEEPPAFIRGLTGLETLVLEDDASGAWMSDVETLLLALVLWDTRAGPAILPSLRRLVVRDTLRAKRRQPIQADVLRDVVRARAAAGVPLKTLALLESHFNEIDAAELQEEVFLEIIS